MRQRDFGRIVNIASIYGLRAAVNRVDYVTTKTALIGFTRAVALETRGAEHHLQRHLPRLLADARHRAAARGLHGQGGPVARGGGEGLHGLAPAVGPLRRARTASRRLVAFLCGPDGADITGAAIPIDGGWSASVVFSGSDTNDVT